jgi:hypothetical protein
MRNNLTRKREQKKKALPIQQTIYAIEIPKYLFCMQFSKFLARIPNTIKYDRAQKKKR